MAPLAQIRGPDLKTLVGYDCSLDLSTTEPYSFVSEFMTRSIARPVAILCVYTDLPHNHSKQQSQSKDT